MPENKGGFVLDVESEVITSENPDVPVTTSSIDNSSHSSPKDQNTKWTPETIEDAAMGFYVEHNDLSIPLLRKNGKTGLSSAISILYPEGVAGLRRKLGLEVNKKPNNYWSQEKIEEHARGFIRLHGGLTVKLLDEYDSKLKGAILNSYPGRLSGLQEVLNIQPVQKPNGYWTPQTIEREVKTVVDEHGGLSTRVLQNLGREDLEAAIYSHYPGGIIALRQLFNIPEPQRPSNYWNSQTIEEESQNFVRQYGDINKTLLKEHNQAGLAAAIYYHYPEQMYGLRQKLGLEVRRKPNGFWTHERIRDEARSFVASHGYIDEELLATHRNDLLRAIQKESGIEAIRVELGIETKNKWPIEEIVRQAREFVIQYGEINTTTLLEHKKGDLKQAVAKYYPGGLTQLQKDLGQPTAREDWTPEKIEAEARGFVAQHEGRLSHNLLVENKRSALSAAIVTKYPGGYKGLHHALGHAVQEHKPNGFWTKERIEDEASSFYLEFGELTSSNLRQHGKRSLERVINDYYPGKLLALQEAIGLEPSKREQGYWTPNRIEQAAEDFYITYGGLTAALLNEHRMSKLSSTIANSYPGGSEALKKKLGIPESGSPPGTWTVEKIETDAQAFIAQHGTITAPLLREYGLGMLYQASNKIYPGGFYGLLTKLGVEANKKPNEYWTIDSIEQEAQAFFNEYKTLSQNSLSKYSRYDLSNAISKKYPGGMTALKTKLNLLYTEQKPKGYWNDPANIKIEAIKFVQEHGDIRPSLLRSTSNTSLLAAIMNNYEGRMYQLRQDIGLDPLRKENGYWNRDTTLAEAKKFFEEHGDLTTGLLELHKRKDLEHAIRMYWSIYQIKKELEIESVKKKPEGFWNDPQNIFAEARAFYEKYGRLTGSLLRSYGQGSLEGAIPNYPGGMPEIKRLLGIMSERDKKRNETISVTHAIEDLANPTSQASQEFAGLLSIFGNSNAIDIIFATHPKFKGIPVKTVKKIIGSYLGDFLTTNRVFNPESLRGATEHLSEPSLREGLSYIVKNDCLAFYNRNKKAGSHRIDSQLIQEYFDILMLEFEDLESSDADGVLLESLQYYDKLLALEHPSSMVTSLREGRSFPDLNQRINIKELMDKKRMLIADEMGLGKSASAILTKETLHLKSCLIISPSNVVSTWQTYLSSHSEGGYFVDGQAPRVLVIENISQLEGDITSYDYVIISQERLNSENTDFLTQFQFDMMIVDEIHKLKNLREGKRTQSLLRLSDKMDREEGIVAMLSGTPVPNKIEDVALILKMLYPERFEAIADRDLISSIIHGDIIDLRNLLLPRMQMKSLTESINLPELIETTEIISLAGISREVYDVLMEEDELTSTEKIQILRKYLLNPRSVDTTPNITSEKIQALQVKLDNHFASHSKAVMFVNDYIQDVIRGETTIFDALKMPEGVRIEIIDGSTSQTERQRIQRELNTGSGRMFVVLSGDTADVGVDLTGAEAAWTYNEPWTKYDKRQQLARVYREGLDHPLESTTFITRDTIEEGINKYIAIKERAIEKLLKGIPLSEIEEEMLRRSEESIDDDLSVNKELAEYYFSSWDRMMKMFAHVKEIGEKDFNKFLEDYGREYADCYTELGTRSYQANASRLSGTLIDTFVRERQQDPSQVRILDIASGPEMLRKHALEQYSSRIVSMDINKHHFAESTPGQQVVGSFLNLPFAEKSFDYANLALAWHYTNFAPSKDNYERLEILAQANRVLKESGRLVISNIYTRNVKDEEKFREIVSRLGFQIVGHYTGEVAEGGSFNSHVYTLQKIADVSEQILEDPAEFAEELGKDLLQGVKFDATTRRLKDTRRIMTQFTINGTSLPIQFNEADQANLDEERRILATGEALKAQYGSIRDIPAEAIMAENYVRLRVKNKYILFKKLSSSNGAVVIR